MRRHNFDHSNVALAHCAFVLSHSEQPESHCNRLQVARSKLKSGYPPGAREILYLLRKEAKSHFRDLSKGHNIIYGYVKKKKKKNKKQQHYHISSCRRNGILGHFDVGVYLSLSPGVGGGGGEYNNEINRHREKVNLHYE